MRLYGAVIAAILFGAAALAAESDFPFDQDFVLEAQPLRGSKRIPNIEVAPDGSAVIELWCNSVKGQFVIAGDTLTILTGVKSERSCSADQSAADDAMMAALNQVTNWRLQGDVLSLTGAPQPLRFRLATN
jgi:heat shock protein HslJ